MTKIRINIANLSEEEINDLLGEITDQLPPWVWPEYDLIELKKHSPIR